MKNNLRKILSVIAAMCLLLFIGWSLGFSYGQTSVPKSSQIRDNSSPYKLIHPLILVDNASSTFPELNPLKNSISDIVNTAEKDGDAEDISVYYRNMITGKWTGVNENDTYAPSSMLKVGILMAYLKIAETDPDVLNEKLYYVPTNDQGQYFKPAHVLSAGEYSVRDLLVQMIKESDNDAVTALNNAHPQELVNVFKALAISYPNINSPANFMSPEIYSRLFRALYNATYLPDIESEQAFELLSQTDFNGGLVQGISASMTVAHKFGEHTEVENGKTIDRELHDCGIVYYPNQPYFLCVMTRGQDFPTLEKIIGNISKSVFDYMSSNYP